MATGSPERRWVAVPSDEPSPTKLDFIGHRRCAAPMGIAAEALPGPVIIDGAATALVDG
jgi:hypothetical protein